MENFPLICCTSWFLYQNQWLEIVLRTPQHHGEALQSLTESKKMTELWPRSPSIYPNSSNHLKLLPSDKLVIDNVMALDFET